MVSVPGAWSTSGSAAFVRKPWPWSNPRTVFIWSCGPRLGSEVKCGWRDRPSPPDHPAGLPGQPRCILLTDESASHLDLLLRVLFHAKPVLWDARLLDADESKHP